MFPGTVFPLTVGRQRSQAAVQEAVRLERPIGVLLQSKPDVDEPGPDDLHWVGTSAAVLRYVTTPDGTHHAVAKGLRRFRVLQVLEGYPFTVARVQYVDDPETLDSEIEGRARALKQRALETLELLPQVPAEMVTALQAIESPGQLADVIAGLLDITVEEKQSLLETFDLKARLDKLLEVLAHRIEVLKVSRDIAERTRESIGDVNRKHLLREQMRTIQKELGEGDEAAAEIDELDKAITEARMPEEVEKVARKELKRLERMPEASGEYSMVRTYLEWLIELPWTSEAGSADRHRRSPTHPRRGPFRAREDQEAHPRIPRGAQAQSVGPEPDPVLRRPARRRQDLARAEHRQGDRAQVRAPEPGRGARRSRDSRPSAHLRRRACRASSSRTCARQARATA